MGFPPSRSPPSFDITLFPCFDSRSPDIRPDPNRFLSSSHHAPSPVSRGSCGVRISRHGVHQPTLSVSNMFFLSIFKEGQDNADANSHYFNLTTNSEARPTAASEGSTSASRITRITLTSTSTTDPTPNPAETSNAPSSGSSGGLDSSAKIRIGVAIPAAAVLGAIASYLIFRRRKRMAEQPPAAPAYHDDNPYNGMSGGN